MAKRASSRQDKIPAKWRKLFELLPGYDPVATKGRGMKFDPQAADRVVDFFAECLHHVKGKLAGEPFVLEPHEQAIVGCIFGWKHPGPDGTRPYREVLYYVARKNNKTTIAAGLVNYVLFCDEEMGAEIYSTGADREQAALVYSIASGMVDLEPELSARATCYRTFKSIEVHATHGVYRAISHEANTNMTAL